jgi:hypothetical protein
MFRCILPDKVCVHEVGAQIDDITVDGRVVLTDCFLINVTPAQVTSRSFTSVFDVTGAGETRKLILTGIMFLFHIQGGA